MEPLVQHLEVGLGRLVLTHLVEDLLQLLLLSSDRLLQLRSLHILALAFLEDLLFLPKQGLPPLELPFPNLLGLFCFQKPVFECCDLLLGLLELADEDRDLGAHLSLAAGVPKIKAAL